MDVGVHLLWNSFFKWYITSWALTAAVETDSTATGRDKLSLHCLWDRKWLNFSWRKWPPLTLTPFHIRTPPPASQKPQTHTIAHAPPCGSRVGLRCFVPPISKTGFSGARILTQTRWYFSHPARANFLPQVHVMRSNKALWVFPHSFNRRIMKSCLF